MAHIIHYAHMEKKIIVHVPKCKLTITLYPVFENFHFIYTSFCSFCYTGKRWLQFPKEVTILKDGGIELPVDAAEWLTHFLNQNQAVIRSLDVS